MKKQSITLMFFALLIIGCNKQKTELDVSTLGKNAEINKSVVRQIVTMSESEQKTAYKLLNEYEKAYVWNNKMIELLNKNSFNPEQVEFIKKIQSQITSELFISNSQKNNDFKREFAKTGYEKSVLLFGAELAKNIITSISNKNNPVSQLEESGVPKCKCSSEYPSYCSGNQWCFEVTDKTICSATLLGCGPLWLFSCDGKCKLPS